MTIIGSRSLGLPNFNRTEYVTQDKNNYSIKTQGKKATQTIKVRGGKQVSNVIDSGVINVPTEMPSKPKLEAPKGLKSSYNPGIQNQESNAGRVAADSATQVARDTLDYQKKTDSIYNKGQMALAGAEFIMDVVNANTAYQSAVGQAQMNITMARNNAADALSRGRQAQLDRQSEGYNAGQDALLAMAAQGQDIQSAGVQKIQGSFEAMGIQNGMREEINSMREALGYELEEIDYERQVKIAKANRNNAIIGGVMKAGIKAATYGAM